MSESSHSAELLIEARCELGEGPIWFENGWWWVDIEAGTIHSCNELGEDWWSRNFGQRVTTFAPIGDQGFLIAFERNLATWNRVNGRVAVVAELKNEPAENRFNDGKVDPAGRFVVGTLNKQGVRGTAGLYSLDWSNQLTPLLDGIHLSNGLAWSADGKTLYHIDSIAHEITAYDYHVETGQIANRRVVIQVPPEMGLPDGMDIDSKGDLWIGHWNGWAVRQWSPVTGECLAEIKVPCAEVTSCRIGGHDGKQLFITTARIGLSAADLQNQPQAGGVFRHSLA